ncbi:sensor histidine kinase [Sunxiuqinia dokdonensis]|uniref:histidine kinase n=1 Tax=Sunxiuqinia dokdonensis TaxID=1409788 RepID=A0A0L8V732_9BACT|nr:ATP-binding protein [Sunxiuqinia dokdonensis]KOH44022.1 histidine kinase [Sunxiuqinia dokdonensis]
MEQQQKIKQTQESILQTALNAAQTGIWHWNIDTDKLMVNEAWANLIGHTPGELYPLTAKRWFKRCHPDDLELIKETLDRVFEHGEKHFSFRARLKHKNGSWVWAQFNGGIAVSDSFGNPQILSGTSTDISELYQSKNNLQYRYEIEKLVSEISSDFVGIQVNEADKVINLALQKIGEFLSVDRCYVFQFQDNNSFMDNTHEWHAPGISTEMKRLQNLPSSVFSWWMKKLNKLEHIYIGQVDELPVNAGAEKEILRSQSIISLLVVPIHFQKNLLGFIGFDSVVKEKEWLEADIHLMNTVAHAIASALNANIHQKVLVEAKEKAEESDQIKSAFLATVNHELRTPLHHILGFSDLLRMNKIPATETSNFADKIYRSGKNLLQIIEDILNLALADESFVQIREEYIKGGEMFLQHKTLLDEMLQLSEKGKSLKLIYNPSPDFVNSHFIADSNKINQVIINLLKNAIKFTISGTIEYRADIKNNKLSIQIKDSGIGIPQHQQKLIFDFFRQIDDSSTRVYSGIGVGLAISKRITKILCGELTVCSLPEKGSTFTLKVPIEMAANLKQATRKM